MSKIDTPHRQQPARDVLRLSARKNVGMTLEFPDNKLLAARWAARMPSIWPASNRSWMSASTCAAIWWRSTARSASAPAPSCARSMPGWKRAKASPWPKWMRRSASPMRRASMRRARSRPRRRARSRPRSPAQAAYLEMMRQCPLVFGIGPAGTGKTYLAAAFAAHMLHERRVDRLILSRPALEAGERLGFLPGDLKEKIDPYLRPLYDALFDVLGDARRPADGAGRDRSGAAGLHARPHPDAAPLSSWTRPRTPPRPR